MWLFNMRTLKLVVFIFFIWCMQTAILPFIPILGERADLIFIVVAIFSFLLDGGRAVLFGLGLGLALDIFIPGYFIRAFLYGGLAFCIQIIKRNLKSEIVQDAAPLSIAIFPVFLLIKNIYYLIMLGRPAPFWLLLANLILTSAVNALLIVVFFPLCRYIAQNIIMTQEDRYPLNRWH